MRTARLSAVLLLSAVVAIPALAGSGKNIIPTPSPIIGVQVMPVQNYTPAAGGGVATVSNLLGGTSKGICCNQTGLCTNRSDFDGLANFYFSIYFDDVSNGALATYILDLGIQQDLFRVNLISNAPVTFNLAGLPAGESFNACIYVQFFMPLGLVGSTWSWGGGIVGPNGETLQGTLGTLHGTPNVIP